jgi:hypothetical protein
VGVVVDEDEDEDDEADDEDDDEESDDKDDDDDDDDDDDEDDDDDAPELAGNNPDLVILSGGRGALVAFGFGQCERALADPSVSPPVELGAGMRSSWHPGSDCFADSPPGEALPMDCLKQLSSSRSLPFPAVP